MNFCQVCGGQRGLYFSVLPGCTCVNPTPIYVINQQIKYESRGNAMKHIKTWSERCEEHPDHQQGMISERMISERMQEEIDELREALEKEPDLARVGEVGVWGECEPQEALEDVWCDWVCPKPMGYLMQCCDCELIHEVDFRVVRYESEDSEVYEVVDDPNLQPQMRLRRLDYLSPKRKLKEKNT